MTEDSSSKRPLLTFALFAYNQEQYIREAVEGAFSQTYKPLEIILSDDCSSDRTFEIMQEMAAAYDGPHRVKVNRNDANVGLIRHVNKIVAVSEAQVIVLAAGDDISLAERAERISAMFASDPTALVIHSPVITIDEKGNTLGRLEPPFTDTAGVQDALARSASIYIGATGAIDKKVYSIYGPITQNETYEDLILGFRACLVDGLRYVDTPLVKYRLNIGISSKSISRTLPRTVRRVSSIRRRLATIEQRRLDMACIDHTRRATISNILDEEMSVATARLFFFTSRRSFFLGILSRNSRHYVRAVLSETKYMLGLVG